MFTGIIETLGEVVSITKEESNLHYTIESPISAELKIDQSVSHNGICLTVIEIVENRHRVTAIQETLQITALRAIKKGDSINLERAMAFNGRLDGHLVQGHVDTVATCTQVKDEGGSWLYTFSHATSPQFATVEKGSICVNGVSLTVIGSKMDGFSVAVIPYTYEHTTFNALQVGDVVNLEFDIIGKYVSRLAGYANKIQ